MNLNLDRPAELGQTSDPRRLVPGDPEQLRATAHTLQGDADAWDHFARQLRTLDLGWTGQAADAHAEHVTHQTRRHFTNTDALSGAAQALTGQAEAVAYAQQQARDAIAAWDQADDHAAQYCDRSGNDGEDDDTDRYASRPTTPCAGVEPTSPTPPSARPLRSTATAGSSPTPTGCHRPRAGPHTRRCTTRPPHPPLHHPAPRATRRRCRLSARRPHHRGDPPADLGDPRRAQPRLPAHALAAHAHKLGDAVRELLHAGFTIETIPLIRAAYEAAVTVSWIAQVPDALPAYLNRNHSQQKALRDTVRKAGWTAGHEAIPADALEPYLVSKPSKEGASYIKKLCSDFLTGHRGHRIQRRR